MANRFLNITKQALARHGEPATYTRVGAGAYDIETGKATNTSVDYTIQMYKKHVKANQYNYPDLIGKDAAIFYIARDAIAFIPNIRDFITFDGVVYNVDSYMEHAASGEVVMFKIMGVRG